MYPRRWRYGGPCAGDRGVAGTARGQDGAKPPQDKDQPKLAKGKAAAPKPEASKPAPVKLGLLISDPKALEGYTLISPFDSSKTFLFDMRGRVVNTWETGCAQHCPDSCSITAT